MRLKNNWTISSKTNSSKAKLKSLEKVS
jgi:hypothetical protein